MGLRGLRGVVVFGVQMSFTNKELASELLAIQRFIQPMSPHEGFVLASAERRIAEMAKHFDALLASGCEVRVGPRDLICFYCNVDLEDGDKKHDASCAYVLAEAFQKHIDPLNAVHSRSVKASSEPR